MITNNPNYLPTMPLEGVGAFPGGLHSSLVSGEIKMISEDADSRPVDRGLARLG